MSEHRGTGSGLVLIVGDDPAVGEEVAHGIGHNGCHAVYVGFEEALELSRWAAVLVLDQIVESDEGADFLRRLEDLGDEAPWVVLLRYAPGPVGPFRHLHVTVVAGERWFEELPWVVASQVYARAWW